MHGDTTKDGAPWPERDALEERGQPEQDPVLRALAELAPRFGPPPGLRSRVLARFREERVPRAPLVHEGITTTPVEAGEWKATPVPGVWFRELHRDELARRRTMLVRMDPGASYPPHVHAGDEECLVLEGDLSVAEQLDMRAGDYQMARAGSRHGLQRTSQGCLLLIRDSLDDRLEVA